MNDDRMHALGQTSVIVQVGDGYRKPPVFFCTSWPQTINDESVFVDCLLILHCGHLEFDSVSTYLFSIIFLSVSYQRSERRTFQTLTLLGNSIRFVPQMLGGLRDYLHREIGQGASEGTQGR
jgi:hypothetical protein